jgi:predicted nucleotidyltransferase
LFKTVQDHTGLPQRLPHAINLIMNVSSAIVSKIQQVFETYPEVAAVYLFGSRAEDRARPDSDYDLAVVSTSSQNARPRRLDLLTDLARVGLDNVDLAFLDQTDLVLCHEAVRPNQLIFARPEFDHGSFFSRIIRMYLDFQPLLMIQRKALKERLLHGTA